MSPDAHSTERDRKRAADRRPVIDAEEGTRLVAFEVAAHVLAAIAGVDHQEAVFRQDFTDHMSDELRLDRLGGVLHHALQLRFPLGARFGDIDPWLAQLRLGCTLGEARDETLRRAGDAECDGKYDADLPGCRTVVNELRIGVEDAVLVHR